MESNDRKRNKLNEVFKILFQSSSNLAFVDGDPFSTKWNVRRAASKGHLNLVKWYHERGSEEFSRYPIMDEAALSGHLNLVEWLHCHRKEACSDRAVLENPHRDILEWITKNRSECWQNLLLKKWLIKKHEGIRDLRVVEWIANGIIERSKEENKYNLFDGFVRHIALDASPFDVAAKAGHLDVVKWFHSFPPEKYTWECTTKAMDGAAGSGHLSMVEWLSANRVEGCTTAAMDEAAEASHLMVVEWLSSNRLEGCTEYALEGAAHSENLQIVQWLYANRPEVQTQAAISEVVLHSNWSPCTQWLFNLCIDKGWGF